jgi:hypothetical protein
MSPRLARPAVLFAVAIALTLSACSGGVVQPIEVAAGCPEQPLRGAELVAGEPADRLIDDFEDGDIFLTRVAGRDGLWIENDDGTSQMQVGWQNATRCAARGSRAAHFSGSGFTAWGANLTAILRQSMGFTATGYDGMAYGGVSFFAAIGSDGPASLDVPVGITTLDTAWNGGVCAPMKCMDYHRTVMTLTPVWRRIAIRFTDLKQQGWGDPQIALNPLRLVGLIMWPDHPFDIWLDDVRFEP